MIKKIKSILQSVRFYIITLGSASAYLAVVAENGFDVSVLLDRIAIWLGIVAGIGTADAIVKKLKAK